MAKPHQVAPPLQAVLRPTTFIDSARLKSRAGLDIVLASETFQVTGSFKFRAAYSVAANVPNDSLITASSGNYGQALAYACKLLGKKCTVVMPDNSAQVKIEAVREFGGVVELVHTATKSRAQRVAELAEADPSAFVASAYDDPFVIEGNATLGKELAAATPAFDAVLVPVGGGGLASGIIKGMREAGSNAKIYAVEPAIANDFSRSFAAGQVVVNESEPQTIADGVRTVSVGKNNWGYLKDGITAVLEVSEEGIQESMRMLFQLANLKCEPTGGVALAGALSNRDLFAGKRICCIVSGGNVDPQVFHRLVCTQ